jgi:hypothetical protein
VAFAIWSSSGNFLLLDDKAPKGQYHIMEVEFIAIYRKQYERDRSSLLIRKPSFQLAAKTQRSQTDTSNTALSGQKRITWEVPADELEILRS